MSLRSSLIRHLLRCAVQLVWHSRLSSAKSTRSPRVVHRTTRSRSNVPACRGVRHRTSRARGSGVAGRRSRPSGIPCWTVRPMRIATVDRYGSDVLSGDWRAPRRGRSVDVPAEPDLVVEEVETGWVGAVVRVEKAGGMHVVTLEDRRGRMKAFPLGPGFLIEGRPVTLTPPRCRAAALDGPARRSPAPRAGRSPCTARRSPGGERLAHLRRGPPRRRARREGVGRRPAHRGRRRRDDGRRRRPRRHHRRLPARAGAAPRRPRRPPRAGHQGGAHRRRRRAPCPGWPPT